MYLQRWYGWCHTKLLPSRRVLCTPYNHIPCHFMQGHIHKAHAYLAVTCHLHFWQNDRDLLHATAVTRGWNGYRNKSQHRKLTLEKKILPPLLQGFEPATFRSRVRRSNHCRSHCRGDKRVRSPVGFAYQGAGTTSMGQALELPTQGMVRVLRNKVYLQQHLLITEQTSNYITDDS